MKSPEHLLRLAVIATPRSGHTWLRLMIQQALELEALPAHHPDECPWQDLPQRFLLAVHWRRTHEFEERLADHGFRIIGIHRHPLDTLISILHSSLHDVQSHRWLNGEGGNEDGIVGAMPRSQAFLDYAVGPRATALLGVNLQWHNHPNRYNICYEDLVRRTEDTLTGLFAWLGVTPRRETGAVVANHTLAALKELHRGHGHFWKGQPGLWRSLLCRPESDLIARAQLQSFQRFGYLCDSDPDLTPAQADHNWVNLIREEQKRVRAEAFLARVAEGGLRREVQRLTSENQHLARTARRYRRRRSRWVGMKISHLFWNWK